MHVASRDPDRILVKIVDKIDSEALAQEMAAVCRAEGVYVYSYVAVGYVFARDADTKKLGVGAGLAVGVEGTAALVLAALNNARALFTGRESESFAAGMVLQCVANSPDVLRDTADCPIIPNPEPDKFLDSVLPVMIRHGISAMAFAGVVFCSNAENARYPAIMTVLNGEMTVIGQLLALPPALVAQSYPDGEKYTKDYEDVTDRIGTRLKQAIFFDPELHAELTKQLDRRDAESN